MALPDPLGLRDVLVPCPVRGCDVRTRVGVEQDVHIRTHLCASSNEKLLYHVRHHSNLYLHRLVPSFARLNVPRFLVNILTGTGRGVRRHVDQPRELRERFMRQIGDCWFMLPDPGKMKSVPKREEQLDELKNDGFVWTAWWIHPELLAQAWWQDEPVPGNLYAEPPPSEVGFDFNESSVPKPEGWLYTYRELTADHLPALYELRAGIETFCVDNLGVDMQRVQIWTHCPVSEAYSTLHIKVCALMCINKSGPINGALQVHYQRPQDERYLGRSVLLDQLIENLELSGDPFGVPRVQDYWLGDQFVRTMKQVVQEVYHEEQDVSEDRARIKCDNLCVCR